MRSSRTLLFAVAVACCTAPQSTGRKVQVLSYQDLLDRSDLVVIASPITRTADTEEQSFLPNIFQQDEHGNQKKVTAIGVETTFRVDAVLKGDKAVQKFVLHHYREASTLGSINGPYLVSFDPSSMPRSNWLLFLVREKDGRYAPADGQTDPGLRAIRTLS